MRYARDQWWLELFLAAVLALATIGLALSLAPDIDAHLPDGIHHQVSNKSARRTAKVIHQTFGKKRRAHEAVQVADCESDLRLDAHRSGSQYYGLFQMGENERAKYNWGPGRRDQIEAAHRLFHDRWWQPWPGCRP